MQIAPFRPLRYNADRISFISRVVAPPYDVISEPQAQLLRESDPHNVIRLILGKGNEGLHTDKEYQDAAATLSAWRRDGVLVRDAESAIYLCEQTFRVYGEERVRRGLLCAALLEQSATGGLMAHEQTRAAPREDRLRLMQACRASLSPVFVIYHDGEGTGAAAVEELATGWPLYEFRMEEVVYRIWRVSDPARIRALAQVLANEQLLIADGHHRHEVAMTYRRLHRDPALPPGRAPEDYLLLYAVSARDKGLSILPTHRLVKAPEGFDRERFLRAVSATFLVERMPAMPPEKLVACVRALGPHSMLCYAGPGQVFSLTDHGLDPLQSSMPERSPQLRNLPVTLLHYGIIEPLLGIPAAIEATDPRILFTPDAEQVYWSVEGARFDLAFLLPPTPVGAVEAVARAGERMPAKSTYFYPKIASGLVIYPLDDPANVPVPPLL
jgi:uncharacterized protein (DUF1015 family)